MKTLLVTIALVAALATPASAQFMNCNTFGFIESCSGLAAGQPYSYSQDTIGGMTSGFDSRGNSWTTSQFGGQTFTNVIPGHNGW